MMLSDMLFGIGYSVMCSMVGDGCCVVDSGCSIMNSVLFVCVVVRCRCCSVLGCVFC